MKYLLKINQQAIIENGLDLDMVDGAIMDFCLQFSRSCETKIEDGICYYWFAHKNICTQLPILKLKPDSIYRRMVILCEKSFLKAHPKNKQLSASWYALCPLANLLLTTIGPESDGTQKEVETIGSTSEPSDADPMGIGPESDGPSDAGPMYNSIIEKENNLNYHSHGGAREEIFEVVAEEVLDSDFEKKEDPLNPQFRAPPSLYISDEEQAELEVFLKKLQTDRRVLEGLKRHYNLEGSIALEWISRFVTRQWTADNLAGRSNKDLIFHCQSWIEGELVKQKDREQRQSSRNGNRRNGTQQSEAQSRSELDRLAEEYFGA